MALFRQRIEPGPGQESVWDYPRPPRLEKVAARIEVRFGGVTVASTENGFRVLETSHPPTYYIPQADIRMELLKRAEGRSICEFKGAAVYWTLHAGGRTAGQAAWSYPQPLADFSPIAGHLSFYASRVDECMVGGEIVQPQQGDFYGGWITSAIVGPFKGGTGTYGW